MGLSVHEILSTPDVDATISLETLRKEGRVGRTKLAGVLRRLASVAREIEDVEDGEAVSCPTCSRDQILANFESVDTGCHRQVLREIRDGHAQAL